MQYCFPRSFVVTGAPCAGKTTTINSMMGLKRWQFLEESARRVLCGMSGATGATATVARADEASLSQRVVEYQLRAEETIQRGIPCVLDRGVLDCLAYARVSGGAIRGVTPAELRRRYRAVFLLDPLPFEFDGARSNFDCLNRERIASALAETYVEFGHELIHVPVWPVDRRARFIIMQIEARLSI